MVVVDDGKNIKSTCGGNRVEVFKKEGCERNLALTFGRKFRQQGVGETGLISENHFLLIR